jgi:hypothetical protein
VSATTVSITIAAKSESRATCTWKASAPANQAHCSETASEANDPDAGNINESSGRGSPVEILVVDDPAEDSVPVPLTYTLLVVAPELACLIVPALNPVDVGANTTQIVLEETVPLIGAMVTLLLYPLSFESDTRK